MSRLQQSRAGGTHQLLLLSHTRYELDSMTDTLSLVMQTIGAAPTTLELSQLWNCRFLLEILWEQTNGTSGLNAIVLMLTKQRYTSRSLVNWLHLRHILIMLAGMVSGEASQISGVCIHQFDI